MKSLAYPGLTVTLRVNGEDLQEHVATQEEEEEVHLDEDTVAASTTCYVEAMDGANFAVVCRFDPEYYYHEDDVRVCVSLDGVHAINQIYSPVEGQLPQRRCIEGVSKLVDQRHCLSKFAFAALETTEGPAKPDLKQRMAHVGEVTVKLNRCVVLGPCKQQTCSSNFTAPVDSAIPEKALKGRAISNHVTLSEPTPFPAPRFLDVDYPWGMESFATFNFRYRSRRDLQIEGIIPRPEDNDNHVPLEDRDINTLTVAELRERLRRQDAQLLPRIKKEKREHSLVGDGGSDGENEADDGDVEIVEVVKKRRKIETIDLSGD